MATTLSGRSSFISTNCSEFWGGKLEASEKEEGRLAEVAGTQGPEAPVSKTTEGAPLVEVTVIVDPAPGVEVTALGNKGGIEAAADGSRPTNNSKWEAGMSPSPGRPAITK